MSPSKSSLKPSSKPSSKARKTPRRGPGRPKDLELPQRRRAEIITHAIDEFAREGFTGADLDVIAKHAGCAKGTLYNYFPSKRELFNAAVDHVLLCMKQVVGLDDLADPLDQLEQLVRGFLQYFADHPHYVELLVQERSDFRDRPSPTYTSYRETARKQWEGRFQQLMEQGRMRRMPTAQVLNVLADLLYGTIFMNHFRRRQSSPKQQAEEILRTLLGGLLTDQEFSRRYR